MVISLIFLPSGYVVNPTPSPGLARVFKSKFYHKQKGEMRM